MMDDNWSIVFAVLFIMAVILVMGMIYPDPRGEERGMERAEREFLMWHEECADLRETAMRRYEERRGK